MFGVSEYKEPLQPLIPTHKGHFSHCFAFLITSASSPTRSIDRKLIELNRNLEAERRSFSRPLLASFSASSSSIFNNSVARRLKTNLLNPKKPDEYLKDALRDAGKKKKLINRAEKLV